MTAVQIDLVSDPASCRIAEDLQRLAWGMPDRGIVPAEQIRAAVHNGGLLLLALADGEPVGFCYGFVGLDGATPILCSHMLAVRPDAQSRGLGRALKLAQRRHAAARGFARITWTFDPLQARNAYLNLHRLGARARRYHVDHYGPMDDAINAGLPTDRLLAEWDVADPDATAPPPPSDDPPQPPEAPPPPPEAPPPPSDAPWAVSAKVGDDGSPRPTAVDGDALRSPTALIAVPTDIDRLRRDDADAGPAWRAALRAGLTAAFAADMVATDFVRDAAPGCHAYVLRASR